MAISYYDIQIAIIMKFKISKYPAKSNDWEWVAVVVIVISN